MFESKDKNKTNGASENAETKTETTETAETTSKAATDKNKKKLVKIEEQLTETIRSLEFDKEQREMADLPKMDLARAKLLAARSKLELEKAQLQGTASVERMVEIVKNNDNCQSDLQNWKKKIRTDRLRSVGSNIVGAAQIAACAAIVFSIGAFFATGRQSSK